jgi:hypothetical protein
VFHAFHFAWGNMVGGYHGISCKLEIYSPPRVLSPLFTFHYYSRITQFEIPISYKLIHTSRIWLLLCHQISIWSTSIMHHLRPLHLPPFRAIFSTQFTSWFIAYQSRFLLIMLPHHSPLLRLRHRVVLLTNCHDHNILLRVMHASEAQKLYAAILLYRCFISR